MDNDTDLMTENNEMTDSTIESESNDAVKDNYIMPDKSEQGVSNWNNDKDMKPIDNKFFENAQRVELPKRSKLVFVVGIIFASFGSVGVFQGLATLADMKGKIEIYGTLINEAGIMELQRVFPVITVFSLIMALTNLIAGIMGILYNRRADKAFIIIGFGILTAGLVVINSLIVGKIMSNILSTYMQSNLMSDPTSIKAMQSASTVGSVIGMLFGMILPVLYTVGGLSLYKRYKTENIQL